MNHGWSQRKNFVMGVRGGQSFQWDRKNFQSLKILYIFIQISFFDSGSAELDQVGLLEIWSK